MLIIVLGLKLHVIQFVSLAKREGGLGIKILEDWNKTSMMKHI